MDDAIAFIDSNPAGSLRRRGSWSGFGSHPSRADPAHAEGHAPERGAPRRAPACGGRRGGWPFWPTAGHPAVFAEWMGAPGKPTLLVYGHHDVQPVDPLAEWTTPPFEPSVREGRLWGRGVVDDKGQVYIHAKAIEEASHRTAGGLPINLRMIVEGEEEGGQREPRYAHARPRGGAPRPTSYASATPGDVLGAASRPCASVCEASPTSRCTSSWAWRSTCTPARSAAGCRDPVNALARMLISSLHDEEGRVSVAGFYDHVLASPRKKTARRSRAALPFDEAAWLRSHRRARPVGRKGITPRWSGCGQEADPRLLRNRGRLSGRGGQDHHPGPGERKGELLLVTVPDQEPEEITRKLAARTSNGVAPLRRPRPRRVSARRSALSSLPPITPSTRSPSACLQQRRSANRPYSCAKAGAFRSCVRIADRSGKAVPPHGLRSTGRERPRTERMAGPRELSSRDQERGVPLWRDRPDDPRTKCCFSAQIRVAFSRAHAPSRQSTMAKKTKSAKNTKPRRATRACLLPRAKARASPSSTSWVSRWAPMERWGGRRMGRFGALVREGRPSP